MQERWVLAAALFVGILWLRNRARKNGEGLKARSFLVFFILAPLILIEPWVSARLPFGRWEKLLIELLVLAAAFYLSGRLLPGRPPRQDEAQ